MLDLCARPGKGPSVMAHTIVHPRGDITAAVALDFAKVLRVDAYDAAHPAIAKWRGRLAQRPAFSL